MNVTEAAEQVSSFQKWLDNAGEKAFDFVIKAAIAVIVFLIVRKLTKALCRWVGNRMEKFHVDTTIRTFTISLLKYGILIFAVITIIVQLNIVEASSIAAVFASAGIGISLALQGGLSNFAGGVLILILKPFKAGDYILIKSASLEGTVKKIELYYTTINTYDNTTILIPNSSLTNNAVVNLTTEPRRKLEIKVGISYESDLLRAKKILENLLDEDSRISAEERQIFVDSLDDSSVVIAFRAWVNTADYWPVKWEMNEKIKLTFDREGIEIPYGQLDVHIRENHPEQT